MREVIIQVTENDINLLQPLLDRMGIKYRYRKMEVTSDPESLEVAQKPGGYKAASQEEQLQAFKDMDI